MFKKVCLRSLLNLMTKWHVPTLPATDVWSPETLWALWHHIVCVIASVAPDPSWALLRTFKVGWLRVALLLVRQSGEPVASTQRQLCLRLLLRAFSRHGAETLRARHRDLKLLEDLGLAVRGAGFIVVVIAAVAVHWMETNHGKHRDWWRVQEWWERKCQNQ